VNLVSYQDGKWDQFYYKYNYDDDNRLMDAYSARYKTGAWTKDAHYTYYHHGPLARMELGNARVQGMDYAYTLQGWLKGMNGQQLTGPHGTQADISGDGVLNSPFAQVGRDVLGYSLGYFGNDYDPIGGAGALAFGDKYVSPGTTPAALAQTGQPLYNGNIGNATYAIQKLEGLASGPLTGFVGYTYRYDQLNRLTGMDRHNEGSAFTAPATWGNDNIVEAYKERVSYDGNGNILHYTRYNGGGTAMDELGYNYNRDAAGKLVNNKLRHLDDGVAWSGGPDIHGQGVDNYSYDAIGNLLRDQAEGLQKVNWTVYGKMASIGKGGTEGISYSYDPSGNRLSKTATAANGTSATTHYVRDAQGNVLAVYQYKADGSGTLTEADWLEQHLYGSSRLGMLQPHVVLTAGQHLGSDAYDGAHDQTEDGGNRLYELTNHLGNVNVTINDRLVPEDVDAGGAALDNLASVVSAQDYYPFGMTMPGRSYIAGGSLNYRYGFNGKENDNEVEGVGNQIDYGMRVYDPRAGRFMSVDPLTKKYPWYTPYQFAGNKPIVAADLDGMEEWMKTQENLLRQNSIEKIDAARVKALSKIPTLSVTPYKSKIELEQQEKYRIQRYQDAGFKDDGSKPFLMRLAENKTFKNFASNIALPLLEGYSYLEGIGELRAAYKGTTLTVDAFSKGGTKLVSSEMLAQFPSSTTFGNPAGTFIAPTSEIDALLSQGLDRSQIAIKLGIEDPAFLKGDLIRVDIESSILKDLNLRVPTGKETGANGLFVRGGKTIGSVTEGVVNGIPKNAPAVSTQVIK
jgi:RHS repeat-associated protein